MASGRWDNILRCADADADGAGPVRVQNRLFQGSHHKLCFVGGGLSTIEAVAICIEKGLSCVVIEKNTHFGGVWCSAANTESRIQVDPISFRPIEDRTAVRVPNPDDPFDSMYPGRDEVLQRMGSTVVKHGLHRITLFKTEVVKFCTLSSGLVRVTLRPCNGGDNNEASQYTIDFKELHIRTGSLSDHRGGGHGYPGEQEVFQGTVARGIGNDVHVNALTDKNVVIVGMGAFAVENVRRSLGAGAKSITVLSRKFDKLLFPERATYTLRRMLQKDNPYSDENITQMWRQVYGLVETVAQATGLEDIILNDECVRTVQDEKHFVFTNGLPSMSSNTMFLAAHYGLVTILEDEVESLEADTVVTKKGKHLPSDVLLKCIGFSTGEGFMKGHVCNDSFFIDGRCNLTHNLRGDRVNGQNLIGPRVQATNFLISYYEDAQEYERCIIRFNECPEAYEEMKAMSPANNYSLVSGVDYFSTLILSDKLARSSDPGIQAILAGNRRARNALYQELLPDDLFVKYDRQVWNGMSKHFAAITGKSFLAYPFDG